MQRSHLSLFIIIIFVFAPLQPLYADFLGIKHFFTETVPDTAEEGWNKVKNFTQDTIYDQGLKQTIYEQGLRDTIYEQGLRDSVFDKGLKPAAAEIQAHGIETVIAGAQNALIGGAAGLMTCGPACGATGLAGGFVSGMALTITDIATEGKVTSDWGKVGKGAGAGAMAGGLEGFIAGGPMGAALGLGIGAGLGFGATAAATFAPNATIPGTDIGTNQLLTNIALGGGAAGITKLAAGTAERLAAKELATAVTKSTLKGLVGGTVTGVVNQEAEHNIDHDSTIGSILVPAIETGTQIATMEAAQQKGLGSTLKTLAASGGVSAIAGGYGAGLKQTAQAFGLTKAPEEGGSGENLGKAKEHLDETIVSKMFDPDAINNLRQQSSFNEISGQNEYSQQAIQAAADNGLVLSPSGKLKFSPDYLNSVKQYFSKELNINLTPQQIAQAETQISQMLQPATASKRVVLPSVLAKTIQAGPAATAIAAQIQGAPAAPMPVDQIVAAAAQRGYTVTPAGDVSYSRAKRAELAKQGYLLFDDGTVRLTQARIDELEKGAGVKLTPQAISMAELQLSANMRAQLNSFVLASPQILAMQHPAQVKATQQNLIDAVKASSIWQSKQAAIAVDAAQAKLDQLAPHIETGIEFRGAVTPEVVQSAVDQLEKAKAAKAALDKKLDVGVKSLEQISSKIVTKVSTAQETAEKKAIEEQVKRNVASEKIKKEKEAKERKVLDEEAKKQKEASAKADAEKAKKEAAAKEVVEAVTGTLPPPAELTPEQWAVESKKRAVGTLSEASKQQQKVMEDTYHQELANARAKVAKQLGIAKFEDYPQGRAALKKLTDEIDAKYIGKVTELPAKPATAAPVKSGEVKLAEVKAAVPVPVAKKPEPSVPEAKTPAKLLAAKPEEKKSPILAQPEPASKPVIAAALKPPEMKAPEAKTPASALKQEAKTVPAKPEAKPKPITVPAVEPPEVKTPSGAKAPAKQAAKPAEGKPAPAKPVVAKQEEKKQVPAKPEPVKEAGHPPTKTEAKAPPAHAEEKAPAKPVEVKHEEHKPEAINHESKVVSKPVSHPKPEPKPASRPTPPPRTAPPPPPPPPSPNK